MDCKAKWDWNISAILGATFGFIGMVYLGICIPLFLNPADPDAVVVRMVFLPMGLVAFFSGFFLLTRNAAKKRRADQLMADGRYIWATVTELREIQSINGLRGHPFVILASFSDMQGNRYTFQSRHIYRKADNSLLGKTVKVYIQGSNYACYYMDPDPLIPQHSMN